MGIARIRIYVDTNWRPLQVGFELNGDTLAVNKTFVVLGAGQSGTSTLTGLINQWSEALCLFEVDFSEPRVQKYRSRYESYFPRWDYLFGPAVGLGWSLRELSLHLPAGVNWAGTKNQELRFDLLDADVGRMFCTVRNPLSWVSHPSTFRSYALARGVTHALCDYVLFIDQAISSGATMFSLEKLYQDPQSWPDLLRHELPGFSPGRVDWWNSMAFDQSEIKVASNWLRAHPTSTRNPADFRPLIQFKSDTVVDEIVDIFGTMDTAHSPAPLKEVRRDRLKSIRSQPNAPIGKLADIDIFPLPDFLNPPPERIGLLDRTYSRLFGRSSRRHSKNG